jgi:hypothetical protein
VLPRLTLGVAVAGAALVTVAPHARATSYDAARSSLPTHVNACWSSDNGTPVLDSFTLSTNRVDVTDGPATVGVTVHAHDVGGPGPPHRLPDAMSLSFRLENAQRWATEHVVLHQTATQTWTGSWTVPQDSPFTTISVDYVHLQPGAGPGRWVSGTELGPDAVVQVTSAHPDSAPPRVADLRVTPDAADVSHGPRQVRLTATVDDDIGVADVTTHVGGDLVRLSPGSGPDEYRGVITVSHWEQRPTLPIVVAAVDVNHVGTRLTSADLASLGLPPSSTSSTPAPTIGHHAPPDPPSRRTRSGSADTGAGSRCGCTSGTVRPGSTR